MKSSSKLRALRFLAVLLFITLPAHAILDLNSNGLSDLWEKQHNNGNLFTISFLPTADPDQDGWDNATEAVAGTDPFEPNPPEGIVDLQLIPSANQGAYYLTWPTIIGKRYRLQASYDLGSWFTLGESIVGIADTHSLGINVEQPDLTIPPKIFWRVLVNDLDDDGDTLTNTEEHQLDTNPEVVDSDGDTLNDKTEILNGTNPLLKDTDLDGIHDNLDATPLLNNAIANPDGANLPAAISQDLRGFWDFESSTLASGYYQIPDLSGGNRHAQSYSGSVNNFGMPSKCGRIGPGYITIPSTTVKSTSAVPIPSYTLTCFFKMKKNFIQDNNGIFRSIFCLYDINPPGPAPDYAPTGQGLGLFVRKHTTTGAEEWHLGGYKQTYFWNEYPKVNGSPKTEFNGHRIIRPAGSTDNEKWHHLAVTKSSVSNGQKLYIDGNLIFQGNLLDYNVNHDADTYFTFGLLHPNHTGGSNLIDCFIDRLRIHKKLLDQSEIHALSRQDIDNDGLWDITEFATAQKNYVTSLQSHPTAGTPLPGTNSQFIRSPYYYENPDTDSDLDGLTDIEEQTRGTELTKPDTDGDGLLDGWEVQYGFNPLVAGSDATADPDGDGLTNLQEYLNNTDPKNANTDGSGGTDSQEVSAGSDPADATNDTAPPPGEMENMPIVINGDYTKWEVVFTGLGPDDKRVRRFRMDNYNTAKSMTFPIRKGNSYEMTMIYQSTIPGQDVPWYCWEAKIDGKTDIGWLFKNHWVVNNSQGLLAAHTHSQGVNKIAGKSISIQPIEVDAVFEKDQVANRIPNPKKPNYYAISTSANPEESKKKYYNRLYVSTEPETGEVEIIVKHLALPETVAAIFSVVITDETGQIIKSKQLNKIGTTEVSFLPSVVTLNNVFYVDLVLTGQETELLLSNYMKNDGLSIQIISQESVQFAKNKLSLFVGPFAYTVSGSFYRTFLGEISGPEDSISLSPLARAIEEEPPTMIAGSIYEQSTWATEIPSFKLPNGSGASNIAETYFSKKAGYGLHQICRDLLEQNHVQIWSEMTTGSVTTKDYTYPIPAGTSLSFYYDGVVPPKYIWGGATYKSGSVTLKLKKNGNKIVATGIEMQAVIEDYYDFDFTRPDNSFSKRAATIEIARELNSRQAGRVFHTLTYVDFSYDESTGELINENVVNGSPPIPFFNDNGYIQDGGFVTTGGAGGTGNE